MRLLDTEATRRALPLRPLIDALHAMFVRGCEVPLRHTHQLRGPQGPGGTVLLMPAWQPGGLLGVKTVTIYPGNSDKGLPGLHSVYQLFDATTGQPLAQLDGNEITSRRTAAASALAASFLAREDASHLLVVGSGRVASLLPEAFGAVRPISRVTVWSRRRVSADALVARLRQQGWDATPSTDLAAAVQSADIVSCATLAQQPLVMGRWLQPGTHLDLIGGFTPEMQECDPACLARARVFVDTEEAMLKAGDMLRAVAAGAFREADLQGTLTALCRGDRSGRGDSSQITLFKSVGTALEDLAAATLVMRNVGSGVAEPPG